MSVSINGSTGISGIDGSASTPALQGSDTNTGLSFGTDIVAINTGGTEALRADSSQRLLVGLTSANTSGGILQLSSGITFPATQVASADVNTLDDYEEGTFTPTITNDGFTRSYNSTYTAGKYTKIGNTVHVEVAIYVSAQSGSNNGASPRINLPFVQSDLAPAFRWNHNILRLAGVVNSEINKLPCAHLTTNQPGYIELCYQNDGSATSTDVAVNTTSWFGGAGNYQIGFSAVYKTS